jgi:chitinase
MPNLSDGDLWHLLGATPMIGQNDVAAEIFNLDDARTLVAFAKEKALGLVSFWAINRDQSCPYEDLAVCSKVNTRDFEFSDVFRGVE